MNVKKNPILAADLLTHETGQFKWRMGVRPLNLNNWLIVDDERAADLHEIRNLIDSRRNQVVYSEPDAASACQELFEEIHFHLKERTGFVNLEVESRSDRPAIESARPRRPLRSPKAFRWLDDDCMRGRHSNSVACPIEVRRDFG